VDVWIYIGLWAVCGIPSLLLARSRGVRNVTPWFFVGTLLGPFGLLLTVMDARPSKPEYTMEALNRLGELRDQGALSEDEYAARRDDLLGRM
jgi:putative oligomerization/nucleic acid binding protein